MDDILERAGKLFDRYERELSELLPPGAELFDAHVHVGRDIDGFVAPPDELMRLLTAEPS